MLSDDTVPIEDSVTLTLRLRPHVHAGLEAEKERTGRSLNTLINDLCDRHLAPAVPPQRSSIRWQQIQAAVACVQAYLGRRREADRAWPWAATFPSDGTTDDLALASAFIGAEIDRTRRHGRPR